MNLQASFNIEEHLLYYPDQINMRKPIWIVNDILEVDAVRGNAAALPYLDKDSIHGCAEFFSKFPAVFVAVSDEKQALQLADLLQENVFGLTVLLPRKGAFGDKLSVRDVFSCGGAGAVDHLIFDAVERPARGLLDMSAVNDEDPTTLPAVLSGLRELDAAIGGFYSGELSVWTGKRGGGKSTFLSQVLLEAIDQGHSVCAFSGELTAQRFKHWISQQAAGPQNLIPKQDLLSGKLIYTVPPAIQKQIDIWWKGRFFLYDNAAGADEDAIIALFELAARRYGCCVFLVDNLMMTRFSFDRDSDFYRAQSGFVSRLSGFAKKFGVHVHLVAHPRKSENSRTLDADDVGGSADITNKADNVFSLVRLSEEDAANQSFQTVLRILKNRSYGSTSSFGLNYNIESRRFYKALTGNPNRAYGWNTHKQEFIEIPNGGDMPQKGINNHE